MIIPIDNDLRIKGEEYAWAVEKYHEPEKSEAYWRAFMWFSTFSQALTGACQREIRLHPASSVTEALEASREVTQKYAAIFDVAQVMSARVT